MNTPSRGIPWTITLANKKLELAVRLAARAAVPRACSASPQLNFAFGGQAAGLSSPSSEELPFVHDPSPCSSR